MQREIIRECQSYDSAYSWVNVTGPSLENEGGYLAGASRISPVVDAEDAMDAQHGSHPDGSLKELLESLCKLSAQFDIDDHSEGPVGYIRAGNADADVRAAIHGLDAMFGEMDEDLDLPDES